MKKIFFVVFYVIAGFLLLGIFMNILCICPAEEIKRDLYLPRLLEVGFKPGVTFKEAEGIIKSYGLEVYYIYDFSTPEGEKMFSMLNETQIRVPEGTEETWVKKLKEDSRIIDVQRAINQVDVPLSEPD